MRTHLKHHAADLHPTHVHFQHPKNGNRMLAHVLGLAALAVFVLALTALCLYMAG